MIHELIAEVPAPSLPVESPLRACAGHQSVPELKRPLTLRDIARRLGVSHVTVSLALRDSPQISTLLRDRVKKTAQSLGYCPNPMATALGHQRRRQPRPPVHATIAWINYWKNPQELRRFQEFQLYWEGALDAATNYGFRLEEVACAGRLSPQQLEKELQSRKIHAVLIPPHREGDLPTGWEQVHWKKICAVRFGYSVAYPAVNVVTSDHVASGLLATENILNLGYKRIGFISAKRHSSLFKAGFFMKQSDLEQDHRVPALVLPEIRDIGEGNLEVLAAWLKKHQPEAVITDIAELRKMLEILGYRVPDDIGLAATSILDGNADAGIYQNSKDIGRTAVEMLATMINRNSYGIPEVFHKVLITGKWVHGSTLPPRK